MTREIKAFLSGALVSLIVTGLLTLPPLWLESFPNFEAFAIAVFYSFASGLICSFVTVFFLFYVGAIRRGRF